MIDFIIDTFHRLIRELKVQRKRYLYSTFTIKNRLTGLIGHRGVGKTTMMLQYIKEELYDQGKTFYFSADQIYFNEVTILEFVNELYQNGGYRIFFIDEIHKYKNWNQELKNLYDSYPEITIVFSGSSMMDLVKGSHDLSRRAILYHLNGMSFREYLNFTCDEHYEPVAYRRLVDDYKSYGNKLGSIENVKSHFEAYLQTGYYPFVWEDENTYYEKIGQIIEKTIYEDIANFYNLKTPNLVYFKKILIFLASIPPGEINTNNLAQYIGIDHKTTYHYLTILESVGLIRFIYPYEGGTQYLRKPQKIFLNNTTLLNAMQQYVGQKISKGTERELFFVQSVTDAGEDVYYSKQGDFRTRDFVFEIGGKNKTKHQIKESPVLSFLIKDDILIPREREIPLYYFGFLY